MSIIIIGAVKSLRNNNETGGGGWGGGDHKQKKPLIPFTLQLSYNNHLPFQKKEKKTQKEQHSYISLPVHRARFLSPLVAMRYITKHRRQPQDTKKNGSLSSLVSVRRKKYIKKIRTFKRGAGCNQSKYLGATSVWAARTRCSSKLKHIPCYECFYFCKTPRRFIALSSNRHFSFLCSLCGCWRMLLTYAVTISLFPRTTVCS